MSPEDRAELADARAPDRKARDAGLILPLAGTVALMPPAAWIMVVDADVLSVPLVVVYVFAVWAALIVAAWRLARRIAPERPARRPAERTTDRTAERPSGPGAERAG